MVRMVAWSEASRPGLELGGVVGSLTGLVGTIVLQTDWLLATVACSTLLQLWA